MSIPNAITEFWAWFQAHADQIGRAYAVGDSVWLDDQISPRIARIQENLSWEIGPYHVPENTFVFSPAIRENLPITRDAVARAPEIPGWRFAPAKPRKELNSLVFTAADSTICADDWRYHLTAYNDGEFVDIELLINGDSGLPPSKETLFSELVVESLIGEECRLDRVGYITHSIVADNRQEGRSTPIRHLGDHLAQVLRLESREVEHIRPPNDQPERQSQN